MPKTTIRALRSQIARKRVRSVTERYFVPRASLDMIFTEETVHEAVAELECEPEEKIGLSLKIFSKAIVVFAILVWMGEEESIVAFRNHDILDQNLPLEAERAESISPRFGLVFAQEYQWQFLPYTFCADMADHHRTIQDAYILPFTKELAAPIDGGFSTVHRMEVYPTLQEFYPGPGPIIIVRKHLRRKGAKKDYENFFKHEVSCLRLLNRLKHPNIIPLLGSYTQFGEHNFLLPCLDMNLKQFFELESPPEKFRQPSAFFLALHGLASALCAVHNVRLNTPDHGVSLSASGYHHDLHPANILVSRGTFILADFGLGRLKPVDEPSKTTWRAGAGDYIAPECMDEDFDHQNVGRSIDVWAFSCLLAEVLTFMHQGRDGLHEFRELRLLHSPDASWRTSHFYGVDGEMRRCVREHLELLAADSGSKMLVRTIFSSMVKEPANRLTAAEIRNSLALIDLRARYTTVDDRLSEFLRPAGSEGTIYHADMELWFERERLRVFGRALGLDGSIKSDQIPNVTEALHSHCSAKFSEMLERIDELRVLNPSRVDAEPSASRTELESSQGFDDTLCAASVTGSFRELVQGLWDVLSAQQIRMVEAQWIHQILQPRDTQDLENIRSALSTATTRSVYQKGAALAAMKKIRMEILSNPSSGGCDNEVPRDQVQINGSFAGHLTGVYRQSTAVLVERMRYSQGWEQVSPVQRAVVLSLKAQSFSSTTKPEGMRLLECLGFFEETDGDAPGYGFVYRLPSPPLTASTVAQPTSLHKLLVGSANRSRVDPHCNQPLLEDKLHLAYALASCLHSFHATGWVHENFNSNFVVFFTSPAGRERGIDPASSGMLREPYIVGLHKSRPAGDLWHTEGPAHEDPFLCYLHPEYLRSKRFRIYDDYYSFGVMLLEIGLWWPAQAWANRKGKGKGNGDLDFNPEELRQQLVDKYVPRLGPRVGSVYRDIVKLCLTDGLIPTASSQSSPAEARDQEVFGVFWDKVLYPLSCLANPELR
ncbi:Protein kinase domain-containing protein [Madurella fahalii]|uniref:Protein kinase domain-containing protein n=1 Tax=Madurella fahalii TaxID=1157608 RepID=A0ABQ0GHC9_9PEZI